MSQIELIEKYFPQLTSKQKEQFEALPDLYKEWNEKINVISRKDIDNLILHHVLHSLAIAKFISFNKDASVLDIGTGGGFPGIPLAIFFPETNFTLADSIGKKIKVVSAISNSLELKNVVSLNERAENVNGKFDFIVSRATAPLSDLYNWSKSKYRQQNLHPIYNGIVCLKGGDLTEETKPFGVNALLIPVNQYFKEEYFIGKSLLYLPVI